MTSREKNAEAIRETQHELDKIIQRMDDIATAFGDLWWVGHQHIIKEYDQTRFKLARLQGDL